MLTDVRKTFAKDDREKCNNISVRVVHTFNMSNFIHQNISVANTYAQTDRQTDRPYI